jgi:hypothetical protein
MMARVSHDQVIVLPAYAASCTGSLLHNGLPIMVVNLTQTNLTVNPVSYAFCSSCSLLLCMCVGALLTCPWSEGKNQVINALTIFEVLEISVFEAQIQG